MDNEAEQLALFDPPQIDNIEMLEHLGRGGMSQVFKARQLGMERLVAVKVLSRETVRDEDGVKRFQLEAKFTSSIEHPNIVKIIAFGISKDNKPYIIMEYIQGQSLAVELKKTGRMHLQKFRNVFIPILSALNAAHNAGLVHRDIKPGNIMIGKDEDEQEIVKLVDFGIAKLCTSGNESPAQQLTRTGVLLGTPAYMSPEQCAGKALDARSDIYSISCVMYEALCGEPPFLGASALEVMHKHSTEPAPTVSELSRKIDVRRELADLIVWGLAKDPAKRPQHAAELSRKLNDTLEKITLDRVYQVKAQSQKRIKLPLIAVSVLSVLSLLCFMLIAVPRLKKEQQNHHPNASSLPVNSLLDRAQKNTDQKHFDAALQDFDLAMRQLESKKHSTDEYWAAADKYHNCALAALAQSNNKKKYIDLIKSMTAKFSNKAFIQRNGEQFCVYKYRYEISLLPRPDIKECRDYFMLATGQTDQEGWPDDSMVRMRIRGYAYSEFLARKDFIAAEKAAEQYTHLAQGQKPCLVLIGETMGARVLAKEGKIDLAKKQVKQVFERLLANREISGDDRSALLSQSIAAAFMDFSDPRTFEQMVQKEIETNRDYYSANIGGTVDLYTAAGALYSAANLPCDSIRCHEIALVAIENGPVEERASTTEQNNGHWAFLEANYESFGLKQKLKDLKRRLQILKNTK